MWEVTTHFAATSQAAGLNVTILLRLAEGMGPLPSVRLGKSPPASQIQLDPGHQGSLSISFCGLNKIG